MGDGSCLTGPGVVNLWVCLLDIQTALQWISVCDEYVMAVFHAQHLQQHDASPDR